MNKLPDYSEEFVKLRDKEKRQRIARFIDRQYSNPHHPLYEYHMKVSAMTVSEKIAEAKRITQKMRLETVEWMEENTPTDVLDVMGGAEPMLNAIEEKERRERRSKTESAFRQYGAPFFCRLLRAKKKAVLLPMLQILHTKKSTFHLI